MNKNTMKLLKAGVAGLARSTTGRGGVHRDRKPSLVRAGFDAELAEGVAEYLERKNRHGKA